MLGYAAGFENTFLFKIPVTVYPFWGHNRGNRRAIIEEWSPENRPFIVALTAAVMKDDRERCHAAGMQGFLSKPMQTNELIDVLKTVPRLLGKKPRHSKPPVQRASSLGKKPSVEKLAQRDF